MYVFSGVLQFNDNINIPTVILKWMLCNLYNVIPVIPYVRTYIKVINLCLGILQIDSLVSQ